MGIKKVSKQMRDDLQQGIYRVINPFVRFMIRLGITPNTVTTIGFLGNLAAACVLAYAGWICRQTGEMSFGLVTLSGALVIGFSLFDMLDGQVARLGNMASRFGAMYDSVLDRYCEFFNLGAIAYYLISTGHDAGALITLLALLGSLMVSYVRARAEGLGIECKIGFMQRPERVVVTAAALLATGIAGQAGYDGAAVILIIAMCVIAVFANLTAAARLGYCRNNLEKSDGKPQSHRNAR